jgi:hypothetical protein
MSSCAKKEEADAVAEEEPSGASSQFGRDSIDI